MNDEPMIKFIGYLLDGDCVQTLKEAERLLGIGVSTEQLIGKGIELAAETLDEKCTTVQFNLLEIMLFGRAATEVMKYLFQVNPIPSNKKGTVVLATLEGDVHDLGKNITKMVLSCKGYNVVDLGKNCPLSNLVDATIKENPTAVGISGLISSVVPLVKRVRMIMDVNGLSGVKVVAGGAALKQLSAAQLNVDFVAETSFDIDRFLVQCSRGIL